MTLAELYLFVVWATSLASKIVVDRVQLGLEMYPVGRIQRIGCGAFQ
jgi:hypothetical protein